MDDDSKSIKEFNIKEGDFIVIMITKVGAIITFQPKPPVNPEKKPE